VGSEQQINAAPGSHEQENLAEREEAMSLRRVLFHKGFFKDLIICTIKIRLEMPHPVKTPRA
jgi:hypothetical protein